MIHSGHTIDATPLDALEYDLFKDDVQEEKARLSLSWPQYIFLNKLNTKFTAFVGGFGSGKTFVGCLKLLNFIAEHPGATCGYFAPTYPTIRDIFYPTLAEVAALMGYELSVAESRNEVVVRINGLVYGKIICRSMDNPSRIIGFKIAIAVVDEIDTMSMVKATDAWNKIIARLRQHIPGVVNEAAVTTTPEGFNFVYQTFMRDAGPDYSLVQASTYENAHNLPPDYISSIRQSYSSHLIEAYLKGEFTNLTSGTVYRTFQRHRCDTDESPGSADKIRVGMDFNVGKMQAKIFFLRGHGSDAVAHFFDEITDGLDTPDMIGQLKERYPDRNLIVYPDATGARRQTVGASKSDILLLRKAGFGINAKSVNAPVRDRINAVNAAFENGRCFVSEKRCPRTVEALEKQAYNDKGDPDKDSGFDHDNDAFGYPVVYEMPVVKPTIVRATRSR